MTGRSREVGVVAAPPTGPTAEITTAPRPRRARGPGALRWGTIAVAVLAWQVALGGGEHDYFAAPSQIILDGVPYLLHGDGLRGLLVTGQEFLIAFAVAAVGGVLLGAALGLSRRMAPALGDAVYLLYTLPQVPFYPLFILALGIGPGSEIAFGVSHGVLPIVLGVVAATARVDPVLLTAVQSMGAGRWARLRWVVLPAVVPELMTALRVGAGLTLVGVIVGQVLVSVHGVGGLIAQLSGSLQAARLDAVVLTACVAAVVVNVVLRRLEQRLSRWRSENF